jgi:hypothetical protein
MLHISSLEADKHTICALDRTESFLRPDTRSPCQEIPRLLCNLRFIAMFTNPTNGPRPEPDESTPQTHALFLY